MNEIIFDENILRRIVRAIDKAIADDIPQYLQEHHKEIQQCYYATSW